MMHPYYGGAATAEGHARPPKGGLAPQLDPSRPAVYRGRDGKLIRLTHTTSRKYTDGSRGWTRTSDPMGMSHLLYL